MKILSIDEMRSIAEKRKGKCHSDIYVNYSTKLSWECAMGHRWKSAPSNIKKGKWCPYCAGLAKLTIEMV